MSRKSGTKWKTRKCGGCGEAHSGYSGKLDKNGVEYVVCGFTHERMSIRPVNVHDIIYATIWEIDDE